MADIDGSSSPLPPHPSGPSRTYPEARLPHLQASRARNAMYVTSRGTIVEPLLERRFKPMTQTTDSPQQTERKTATSQHTRPRTKGARKLSAQTFPYEARFARSPQPVQARVTRHSLLHPLTLGDPVDSADKKQNGGGAGGAVVGEDREAGEKERAVLREMEEVAAVPVETPSPLLLHPAVQTAASNGTRVVVMSEDAWNRIKRVVSTAVDAKNTAEAKHREAQNKLLFTKKIDDLEYRVAKLQSERIELLRDLGTREAAFSSSFCLKARLEACKVASIGMVDALEASLKTVQEQKHVEEKLEEGMTHLGRFEHNERKALDARMVDEALAGDEEAVSASDDVGREAAQWLRCVMGGMESHEGSMVLHRSSGIIKVTGKADPSSGEGRYCVVTIYITFLAMPGAYVPSAGEGAPFHPPTYLEHSRQAGYSRDPVSPGASPCSPHGAAAGVPSVMPELILVVFDVMASTHYWVPLPLDIQATSVDDLAQQVIPDCHFSAEDSNGHLQFTFAFAGRHRPSGALVWKGHMVLQTRHGDHGDSAGQGRGRQHEGASSGRFVEITISEGPCRYFTVRAFDPAACELYSSFVDRDTIEDLVECEDDGGSDADTSPTGGSKSTTVKAILRHLFLDLRANTLALDEDIIAENARIQATSLSPTPRSSVPLTAATSATPPHKAFQAMEEDRRCVVFRQASAMGERGGDKRGGRYHLAIVQANLHKKRLKIVVYDPSAAIEDRRDSAESDRDGSPSTGAVWTRELPLEPTLQAMKDPNASTALQWARRSSTEGLLHEGEGEDEGRAALQRAMKVIVERLSMEKDGSLTVKLA